MSPESASPIATPDRTLVGTDGAALGAQPRRIVIFDTTLRDGEQSPGCSMNLTEKLEVAQLLTGLGVDVIEAGFPIASPGDHEAVTAISQQIHGPVIAGLARCRQKDIESATSALRGAERARIHLFLATSAIHREFKLKMTEGDILKNAELSLKMAKEAGFTDIEFSPEDAARTEDAFLRDVVELAIENGATTVNIPDTVGYTMPAEFSKKIRYLLANVPNISKAVISVHCHNDLGMAVANSLAAVQAGAGQVECTINGIGERAGNCSLEEVVMAMRTRFDIFNCETGIQTKQLVPISRRVAQITGARIARNKAIVGPNAFSHEAGIHQDGMLKNRRTYEIMRPEDVGAMQTDLVLGKHSGTAAIADRLKQLGIAVTGEQVNAIFERFKVLADQKKEITNDDLIALAEVVTGVNGIKHHAWELMSVQATSDSQGNATATLVIHFNTNGEDRTLTAEGDGPIDAITRIISHATQIDLSNAVHDPASSSKGGDALSRYTVELEMDGRVYKGKGVHTDTIQAAAQAEMALCNQIAAERKREAEHRAASVGGDPSVQ